MKRNTNRYSLLLAVPLGIAVLFLSACENDLNVSLAQNGKIVLNPNYKDHIKWAGGLQVHFLVSPCTDKSPWISDCEVNIEPNGQRGQYNYICKGGACSDPEVDVGPSTRPRTGAKNAAVSDPQPDFQVALPCESGTIQPSPAALPGDFYGPVTAGKVVQWLSNGIGSQFLNDWIVTFDAGNATVCTQPDIHDASGYRSCTIKPVTTATTYSYTVTTAQQCKSAGGTVTVTP